MSLLRRGLVGKVQSSQFLQAMTRSKAKHTCVTQDHYMTAYRNYFFDCDGVLWHGDNVLPGVKDHLAQLRYRGKNVFFLTNSALKTREQLLAKFQQLGIEAKKEECYTSAYAAALFLKSQGFSSNGKRAFVVGMGALEKELAEAGVDFCGGTQTPLIPPSEDESIGAVVVGIDLAFNYEKLVQASLLLRYKPDVLFIATNADAVRNGSDGRLYPGAGTIVKAIETGAGRSAQVVGKPSTLLLSALAAQGVDVSQSIMVGDRLDTDIAFGQHGKMAATMLMMTGVTCRDTLAASDIQPTYVCESFLDIHDLY